MHFIYKIVNSVNGKIYIGQTNKPEWRWKQHKYSVKYANNTIITGALTKYGVDKFTFDVIATCRTLVDANDAEIAVIAQYDSTNRDVGYNLEAGGNNSPRSEETRRKISERLKGRKSWAKGKKFTEEHKRHLSESSVGKAGTNTGKKFDEEWKLNQSKGSSGVAQLKHRKFAQEIEVEICRLYIEEEKSTYALGIEFECNRSTIKTILLRNNVKIRQSSYTGHKNNCNIFTAEQELEVCRIFKEGKITIIALSKQFGCGKTTIRDVLLRNGVDLKTRK